MGAPVAFQGATMAGFGGATATSGASLFAASSVMPVASTMSSMMMNPAILNPGGAGGLLGAIGTAADVVGKYSNFISAGFSGIQSINAYQRGQFLEDQYKMQAEQVRTEQEIKRLNILQAANDKSRELLALNASNVAAGFAGGVNSFDGSVKLVSQKNEERVLRDLSVLEFNEKSSELFADAQSSLLTAAADEAVRGSKFDALRYLGGAFYMYNQARVG